MKIAILPQLVVDRIAAGEVVQRPAAAVKELIENSLDAGATEIKVQTDGLESISISDDGCGIEKEDLELAAVRHATSKLKTADDLSSIQSFGFRGEALASISMVSRLTIVSKTNSHPAAYKLSYIDGIPTTETPLPTARTKGTTVNVQSLFYNMPNRRKMRLSEEYNAILKIVQFYAIHYSNFGVAINCQKTGSSNSSKTDLNTLNAVMPLRKFLNKNSSPSGVDQPLKEIRNQSVKQVISQVFGSNILQCLDSFNCEMTDSKNSPLRSSASSSNESLEHANLIYQCNGMVSSSSYQSNKGIQFILFVNNRFVDGCAPLKRMIEGVYADFTNSKPFFYISLVVPPNQVDVNVHPTKREVALLHMDEICNDIAAHLKVYLSAQGQSFATQSFDPKCNTSLKKRKQMTLSENSQLADTTHQMQPSLVKDKHEKIAPNKLIRTSRSVQSGSLEPFLISTQNVEISATKHGKLLRPTSEIPSPLDSSSTLPISKGLKHSLNCPLLKSADSNSEIDLSVPGMFATVAAKCVCNKSELLDDLSPAGTIRQLSPALRAPKQIQPHPCSYKSVQSLRKRIIKYADSTMERKIRSACFVGVASHHRSFIQCGEELVMINHYECAREMFYQLALNRFGSGDSATFAGGSGLDILPLISQVVQMEEMIHDADSCIELEKCKPLPVTETNNRLAEQAAECLLENAAMLKEYFAICIKKNERDSIVLTELPLLLDGYEPFPHGIPLFLLRLATEVDWTNEKLCFHGVCSELASFYAQLPSDENITTLVQHTLFPAISTLLIPSADMIGCKGLTTLAKLSGLYKVFERC